MAFQGILPSHAIMEYANETWISILDSDENVTVFGDVTNNVSSESSTLPEFFTTVYPNMWPVIYAYVIIFVVAAVGNFVEFCWVYKRLKRNFNAMNRLLLHLCIADIIVTFMVAAVEILWRIYIGWFVGNFLCKVIQYLRAFGLYLSSLMVVCLSLDRFYAVVYPLRAMDGSKRIKVMIRVSWISAAICATPQLVIFRVECHPYYPTFTQCSSMVTKRLIESTNSLLSLSFMYFIPIFVILVSYGGIVYKLTRNSSRQESRFLRRSSILAIDRAKTKTLKLSTVIIIAFVICWTPYVFVSIWYIWDRESVESLSFYTREALFLMVIANSSVNPLVYGLFNTKIQPYL